MKTINMEIQWKSWGFKICNTACMLRNIFTVGGTYEIAELVSMATTVYKSRANECCRNDVKTRKTNFLYGYV